MMMSDEERALWRKLARAFDSKPTRSRGEYSVELRVGRTGVAVWSLCRAIYMLRVLGENKYACDAAQRRIGGIARTGEYIFALTPKGFKQRAAFCKLMAESRL